MAMNKQISADDFVRMVLKGRKFKDEGNRKALEMFGLAKKRGPEKRKLEEESEENSTEIITDPIKEESEPEQESDSESESPPKKKRSKEYFIQMHNQKINQLRKKNRIYIYGTDVPAPLESFEQLTTDYNVSKTIVKNLLKQPNYVSPSGIQMQSWPLMIQRRELLASAPTGSGKTASFLVPILHHLKSHTKQGFRAVILAPSRELAKQIVRESDRIAEGTGLITSVIYNVKPENRNLFFKQNDICVTTPNRLIFLMQESQELRNILSRVEWLVVDESDRLYEGGSSGFRKQLATIYKACSGPNVVRAMYSATFDPEVEKWCKLNLNNPVVVSIGERNTSCPDVDQELIFAGSETNGKIIALREILNKGYKPLAMIFVQTRERAKQLYKELLLDDRKVGCIHAEQTQAQRDQIVESFREHKIWVLICTELMGRGIDFIGINLVINFDFPSSVISYIHRVGRTGRAGRRGVAKTLWTLKDKPLLRSIAKVIQNSGGKVDDFLLNLAKESKYMKKNYTKALPDRGFVSQKTKMEYFESQNKYKKKRKAAKLRKQETNSDVSSSKTPENGSLNNENLIKKKKKNTKSESTQNKEQGNKSMKKLKPKKTKNKKAKSNAESNLGKNS